MNHTFSFPLITFVEIGCRKDAWVPMREIASHVRLFIVESDDQEQHQLIKKITKKPWHSWKIIPHALGACEETKILKIAKQEGLSSLYEPDRELISTFEDIEPYTTVRTTPVTTKTLDGIAREYGFLDKGIDLLKIDVQGSEYPILTGANSTLKKILAMYIELEFAPLYKDQRVFDDIHALLVNCGFHLHDLLRVRRTRVNFPAYSRPQLLYGYGLYVRVPQTQEQTERLAAVMASLGYFDYATELSPEGRDTFINLAKQHAHTYGIKKYKSMYHDRKEEAPF